MDYQIPIERIDTGSNTIIQKFRDDFLRIKSMGWIQSNRSHNTGIGKTFEDVIGVKENNAQYVDYMDFLELKSQRDYTGSMLTLFTKSPDYPPNANTILRETFGVLSEKHPEHKILHTTVSGEKFNSFKENMGFKLSVDEKIGKIFLLIKNLQQDQILENNVFYDFDTVKKIVENKCKNIAYINAETKIVNNIEYFKYVGAVLLTGCTFPRFIDAVKKGIIVYDIRIGVYNSGKNLGKTHDHGSGFRIPKRNIEKLFTITNIS